MQYYMHWGSKLRDYKELVFVEVIVGIAVKLKHVLEGGLLSCPRPQSWVPGNTGCDQSRRCCTRPPGGHRVTSRGTPGGPGTRPW